MAAWCRPRAGRMNLCPARAVRAHRAALMARLTCLFALPLAPGIATADKIYNGAKGVTHDCAKEPNVLLNDGEGSYKFIGACTKIAVTGGDNKLVVASVKELSITGGDNTAEVEAVDKISITGAGNKVS